MTDLRIVTLSCVLFWMVGCASAPPAAPVQIVDRGANAVSVWGERGAAAINEPALAVGTPQERRPIYLLDMAPLHLAIHEAVSPAPPGAQEAAAHAAGYTGRQRAADGVAMGALAENLAHLFGTRELAFAFDSTVTNTTRAWSTVDGIANECREARIVGGMHFRHATLAGEQIGVQTAQWAAARLAAAAPQR